MNVYINSSDFTKERINNYNKMRKSKINNQLFNKEKNFHQKLIKLPQKVTMKNNLIFITKMNLNIDYIKYGLYLLYEKMNLG